ncbi:MAG: DNA mismatch repair endonuclease MutL [Chloroflexi bacterium]|nr:DNA mismatch repair endonuclease MutL [Chloroflexota bacterium]
MSIRVLPHDVASQIAAGELVERPASVVKELLENSLDAAASHIIVTIVDAGRKLIEVADDGIGIPSDELALSVARHSTSKLSTAEDLFHISTLGFRGEALASIGSVSRLTITSRPIDAESAARVIIEGGQQGKVNPIGAPVGTVVRVEDLFYKVPARLKFLKKDSTERRHITSFVIRYALAYPDVRFQLIQAGKTKFQTSGNGDRREVLASLYNSEIARQMLEVNTQYEELRVQGFISPTSLTRASRREITFFINGRWVQDSGLNTAVVQAYHTMLMVGRFPLVVLLLSMPHEKIDVNVHPAKTEVRFREKKQVFSGIQSSVRRAMLAHTPVPKVNTQISWATSLSGDTGNKTTSTNWKASAESDAMVDGVPESLGDPSSNESTQDKPQTRLPESGVPLLRLVGQIGAAYLVAEGPDGLYLVDQHAAHERILFERFMAQRQAEIPSQALLEPVTVELGADQASLLSEQLDILGNLGFQVEEFGPKAFIIRAIPSILIGTDPEIALRVVVEDFEEDETPLQEEIEAKIVARVCKRAAVKTGQSLSVEEQRALLSDLEVCTAPRTCPHGRPTMIHLSIDLLERQFGRKGAR